MGNCSATPRRAVANAVSSVDMPRRSHTTLITAKLTSRPWRNDRGYEPQTRLSAFSMTVKIHEAAQSIAITQLTTTLVDARLIDSRFFRMNDSAPGKKTTTWE